VAQGEHPEFKPQYHRKKKEKKEEKKEGEEEEEKKRKRKKKKKKKTFWTLIFSLKVTLKLYHHLLSEFEDNN
jgi:glutamine amidotransferase-like uncharacterized protein